MRVSLLPHRRHAAVATSKSISLGWKDGLVIFFFCTSVYFSARPVLTQQSLISPQIHQDGSFHIGEVLPHTDEIPEKDITQRGWVSIQIFAGQDDIFLEAQRVDKTQWYAQVGQDAMVAGLMRNKTQGYFVDLAANSAVYLSNTLSLEQRLHWTGKCKMHIQCIWSMSAYLLRIKLELDAHNWKTIQHVIFRSKCFLHVLSVSWICFRVVLCHSCSDKQRRTNCYFNVLQLSCGIASRVVY
jgi:hypothetical protein